MDPLALLLFGFATWRLATMIVREDGPFKMFYHLREAAGITHDADRHVFAVPDRFLPGLLSCVWCSSVWIGANWVVLWLLVPKIAVPLAAIFALSALAIGYDRLITGQRTP